MDKDKIIIIVLSVLVAIMASILCIKSIKVLEDKKGKNSVSVQKYNIYDLEECLTDNCDKKFRFLDNEIEVIKSSDGSYKILYNDYELFASADKPYLGNTLFTYEDSIIFTTRDEKNNLKIMKYSPGNFEAEEIEFDKYWFIKEVNSKDNVMTVKASRFINNLSLADVKNETFVDISECLDYKEFEETEVEGTFEIVYKDGAFSKPNEISKKKLNEFGKYSSLCPE